MVVVVAVVMFVFVRPGVIVPEALSTQDTCAVIVETAALVTTRMMSDVLVSSSIRHYPG